MSDALAALRGYVHFLHEREGLRHVRLTRAAREGLAKLVAGAKEVRGGRQPPGDGAQAEGVANAPRTKSDVIAPRPTPSTVARRSTATDAPPSPLEQIAVVGSNKKDQLAHLNARAQDCQKCAHLVARRHTVVFGVGDPEAQLMFVGEGPGEEEDLQGEPFVGRAGQLLTKMIVAMGLTRESVYIANIVKCRPDMPPGVPGNRKPTRQEMETCVPFLRAQIDVIQPRAIVALGATAIDGLVGATGPMGSLRGKFLEYRGVPVMPTYHPSYLLRNQSIAEKRKVWEDLLQVMEKLGLPVTDKQRGFFLKA